MNRILAAGAQGIETFVGLSAEAVTALGYTVLTVEASA